MDSFPVAQKVKVIEQVLPLLLRVRGGVEQLHGPERVRAQFFLRQRPLRQFDVKIKAQQQEFGCRVVFVRVPVFFVHLFASETEAVFLVSLHGHIKDFFRFSFLAPPDVPTFAIVRFDPG